MNSGPRPLGLQYLPEVSLSLILRYALNISPDGVLQQQNKHAQQTAIALARTSSRLRAAVANAIREVRFTDGEGFWPSATILASHAWHKLDTLDCTINRSGLLGFLKWLIPAAGIERLRLKVVGAPYLESRLAQLERLLLGRLFTQVGNRLMELDVSGLDCQALLFASLFQCTNLRKLRISHYGEANTATMLNMSILLCLMNRQHLESIELPFSTWKEQMEVVPSGPQLYKACEVTWATLFGSYRAGLKESAVNLPSDESELAASFRRVSLRMDSLEEQMKQNMTDFRTAAPSFQASDVPEKILRAILPNLLQVNNKLVESNRNGLQ